MKPRYVLVSANPHSFLFRDANTVRDLSVTNYLMPRWRWAEMCKGRWK